jgi:hypothetical protein
MTFIRRPLHAGSTLPPCSVRVLQLATLAHLRQELGSVYDEGRQRGRGELMVVFPSAEEMAHTVVRGFPFAAAVASPPAVRHPGVLVVTPYAVWRRPARVPHVLAFLFPPLVLFLCVFANPTGGAGAIPEFFARRFWPFTSPVRRLHADHHEQM